MSAVHGLSSARRLWSIGTSPVVRALAWVGLIGASGLLVRGEVSRPDRPDDVRVVADLVYRSSVGRRGRLDVYLPEGAAPRGGRPALLAIHGGGWRGGGKADYGRSLVPLVRRGLVVVAVDYRLSRPGSPSWPENIDDVRAALRWVYDHAADFGIDRDRVAAIGSSAGGHLALLLATSDRPAGRAAPVRAVIDFYGPTDLRTLFDSGTGADRSVGMLLGGTPETAPERFKAASPLSGVRPGLPPVLIVHGDDDPLVPAGQSRALAESLERAGVPHRLITIAGARHGFGLVAGNRDLVPDILAFLDGVWGEERKRDEGRRKQG